MTDTGFLKRGRTLPEDHNKPRDTSFSAAHKPADSESNAGVSSLIRRIHSSNNSKKPEEPTNDTVEKKGAAVWPIRKEKLGVRVTSSTEQARTTSEKVDRESEDGCSYMAFQ